MFPPATEITFVKPSVALAESEIIDLPPADQSILRIYMSALLCFPLGPGVDPRQVYWNLCCGLSDMLVELPFFAGRVVRHDAVRDRVQIELSVNDAVPFKYNDLASPEIQPPFPDYHQLEQSHFPSTSVDDSLFPHDEPYPIGHSSPALQLQVTSIKGGILLAVCMHHSTIDVCGWTVLLKSWAKHTAAATRGSRNTPCRSHETLDRSPLFQVSKHVGLEEDELLVKVDDIAQRSEMIARVLNQTPAAKASSNILNVTWYFSPDRLRALKAASQPIITTDQWISTSDALCALLWRHVIVARKLKESGYEKSTFALPCNIRGRLSPKLSPEYIGNATICAQISFPIEALYSTAPDSLYLGASSIRKAINRLDNRTIRDHWGVLDSLPTMGSAKHNINIRPGPDFFVTTIAAYDWYGFDWGVQLGHMARQRWKYDPLPGVTLIQPRDRDGGLEVHMTLEREVFERLRLDERFTSFAKLRCLNL